MAEYKKLASLSKMVPLAPTPLHQQFAELAKKGFRLKSKALTALTSVQVKIEDWSEKPQLLEIQGGNVGFQTRCCDRVLVWTRD